MCACVCALSNCKCNTLCAYVCICMSLVSWCFVYLTEARRLSGDHVHRACQLLSQHYVCVCFPHVCVLPCMCVGVSEDQMV